MFRVCSYLKSFHAEGKKSGGRRAGCCCCCVIGLPLAAWAAIGLAGAVSILTTAATGVCEADRDADALTFGGLIWAVEEVNLEPSTVDSSMEEKSDSMGTLEAVLVGWSVSNSWRRLTLMVRIDLGGLFLSRPLVPETEVFTEEAAGFWKVEVKNFIIQTANISSTVKLKLQSTVNLLHSSTKTTVYKIV